MLALLLACAAPSDPATDSPAETPDPTVDWVVGEGPLAPVEGRAFLFGPAGDASLEGGVVSVMEAPEWQVAVDAEGRFTFEVPSGRPLSFVFEQEGFMPVQSGTIEVGTQGISQLGFQVPTLATADLMALAAELELDPERCQIATTVSSEASPPYGGAGVGEPGAVAQLEPEPGEDAAGPIYFDYISESFILPDPELTETTIDGGVLYGNVPLGEYRLRAEKEGVPFTEVKLRCRAGVLVNASPPHGIEFDG